MNRREFLRAAAAGVALSTAGSYVPLYAQSKPRRVGLIGPGWYGKSALFRLLQIEPVEVVALCDVDKRMLAEAAEMVAARQKSKKTPRTFGDYREMLKQEQFDIVHVATPDHWHALAMIAAVKAGADVYVEKPISVDVVEGQAMLAAARKYKRVVQVNMQRRSTPHLIEAIERVIKPGKLGKVAYAEICCYYHMRAGSNPAGHDAAGVPRLRDVDRPGPDAAVLLDQPPARLAGLHGVRQRHRRRYVRAHARHGPLDARPGLAETHQLLRRHPRGQEQQGQHHRHADRDLRLRRSSSVPSSGPTAPGALRPTRSIPGPPSSTATRAPSRPMSTSTSSSRRARARSSKARPSTSTTSTRRTETEKDLERHVASADARALAELPRYRSTRAAGRSPTSSRATSPPPRASWPTCPASSAGR